ncbi:MAG: site-2 protease family protein [Chloroflexota bacterium]|nr:site-2 protease family protein [Chloroflexota bacterium]
MESSFTIARIRGIPIGVHYTWLLAFALISWSLAAGYFPSTHPGWPRPQYWLVGSVAALLLFVSVLLHELTHSFVAQARGLKVHSITLFIFGGVSNIQSESEDPQDEFLVAVVGPLSSLVIAGVCWLGYMAVPGTTGPANALLGYLWLINLMLALFNILPGFPLDGGRVLRAILWGTTGSMVKGTRWASYVGQAVAFLFIGWGLWQILERDYLNGLWIGFIGWFLNSAAEAARRQTVVQETFRGITVASVMQANPPMVSPAMPVRELVDEYILRRGLRAFPVARDGLVVGLVTLTDVKRLPVDQWDVNTVGAIMTKPPLKTIEPRQDLSKALDMLVREDVNQVLVVENGAVLGLLSRGDVMRFLQMRHDLGLDR